MDFNAVRPPTTPRLSKRRGTAWACGYSMQANVKPSFSNFIIPNKREITRPTAVRPKSSRRPTEYQILKKSADSGNAEAQYHLGDIHFTGNGVALDRTIAIRYFKTAASNGNARAQAKLGEIYNFGWGIGKNPKEAASYFKLAAEQGDPYAIYMYGQCLLNGNGIKMDIKKAVDVFFRGCTKSSADCQYQYGMMAMEGIGMPKNLEIARNYFMFAEMQGHQMARMALLDIGKRI